MDTLAAIIVGLGSGCVGSLLTTLLAPPIQHHFWKQQRRSELCLDVAKRMAILTGRFEEQLPSWKQNLASHERSPGKSEIFYQCLAIDAEVRVLFSKETWEKFAVLRQIILTHSSITHDDTPYDIEAFNSARSAAMTALYCELGLASPDNLSPQP